MIYELTVNNKVVACSSNLEWIMTEALPFHQKWNRAPVIFSERRG